MLRIHQLRKRKGVSLRELARLSGVGAATLSRIEAGVANPRLTTLLHLAKVLGVFVGDLFEKPSQRKEGRSHGTDQTRKV
jgi:transcriptional regulator with XRE-family HTH domain